MGRQTERPADRGGDGAITSYDVNQDIILNQADWLADGKPSKIIMAHSGTRSQFQGTAFISSASRAGPALFCTQGLSIIKLLRQPEALRLEPKAGNEDKCCTFGCPHKSVISAIKREVGVGAKD